LGKPDAQGKIFLYQLINSGKTASNTVVFGFLTEVDPGFRTRGRGSVLERIQFMWSVVFVGEGG
jgi:hypothetical protein